MWFLAAIGSAFFAGITAVLAKCGIQKTDSDLATALRTAVVLVFSWIMVFVSGSQSSLLSIGNTSLLFLVLSGLSTGASWLCYFKALSLGDVNKVAPIDKSSTILTVLLAIICFAETDHLPAKLLGTALLAVGIFLMLEKKETVHKSPENRKWLVYAILSAVFASLTSILAKIGISDVESNLGTALRTAVVLIMAWVVVFAKGKRPQWNTLDHRETGFLILSGLATGASWLCYYYAIQNGVVSVAAPIDKMSLLVTILFSRLFLKERISRKACLGLCLMLTGTLIMAVAA